MANRYYDNSPLGQRFQPGTTVRSDEVDGKFDEISAAFDAAENDIDRSIKLPATSNSEEISESVLQRRNRLIGFDDNGDLALRRGFTWRGDWQASIGDLSGQGRAKFGNSEQAEELGQRDLRVVINPAMAHQCIRGVLR